MIKSNLIKIMWIDDEEEHVEDAKNLENRMKNFKILFIDPSDMKGIEDNLAITDLFLIDDRFYKSFKLRNDIKSGFSIGAEIREKCPEKPIYLFSAVKDEKGIHGILAQASDSLADSIFDLYTIQRYGHNILYYDALDYKKIRESERNSVEVLFQLLRAPEEEHEKLLKALPHNLKKGLSQTSSIEHETGNSIAFGRWVKKIFLNYPGFLLNSEYSAVRLGLSKEYFKKIAFRFSEAEYKGIFSQSLYEKRWWNSELLRILFNLYHDKYPDGDETDPRKVSLILFDLKDKDRPRCVVCCEEYPDTIGLLKDNDDIKEPVHYRCSEIHPDKERIIYFDEIRQFE